jgi:hypothetical protein
MAWRSHSTDAAGADLRSWEVPECIGSMAPREKDGAILSLRDRGLDRRN